MLVTILAYFLKIGIPVALLAYGAKIRYQEEYLKSIVSYVEKIKELDTENKLWETRYSRVMTKYDLALQENEKLRINLGVNL